MKTPLQAYISTPGSEDPPRIEIQHSMGRNFFFFANLTC